MKKYRILEAYKASDLEDKIQELMEESDNLYDVVGFELEKGTGRMVAILELRVSKEHGDLIDSFKDKAVDIGYPGVNIPKPSIEPINGPLKMGGVPMGIRNNLHKGWEWVI